MTSVPTVAVRFNTGVGAQISSLFFLNSNDRLLNFNAANVGQNTIDLIIWLRDHLGINAIESEYLTQIEAGGQGIANNAQHPLNLRFEQLKIWNTLICRLMAEFLHHLYWRNSTTNVDNANPSPNKRSKLTLEEGISKCKAVTIELSDVVNEILDQKFNIGAISQKVKIELDNMRNRLKLATGNILAK
jgi:hypothetical protein